MVPSALGLERRTKHRGDLAREVRIARRVVAEGVELRREAAEVVDHLRLCDGVHADAAARLPVRRNDGDRPRAVEGLAERAEGARHCIVL